MRKLLIAAGAAAFLSSPAFAQTVVIQQEPAPPPAAVIVDEGTLPGDIVTYVQRNPIDSAPVLEGRLVNGTIVPADVQLAPVQGYSGYSYFYQDGAPVIVDSSRRVVRIVR
ncbi:DUF1236 domain-containing protein [Aureimonas psammosilenae]|uniref:DUF1236 domain-containing protein n=1 Tax=Aureimonas psammosilenae TaxID=2495496 RepID=UPI0012612AE4|nr:DUF1236 domain-containing protein [Aureimonas psammosilenae]